MSKIIDIERVMYMSFVSIVATENFITVMSDGRVTGKDNDEILQEDYQKFMEVANGKAFIAYAGTKDVCELIAQHIKIAIENGLTLEDSSRIVRESINAAVPEDLSVMFSIGGINELGKIEFYTYDSKNNLEQHFLTEPGQISYAFLNNSSTDIDFNDEIKKILRETGFSSPSETIQAQRLLNNRVADVDDSVNKKTSRFVIKK